MGKIRGSQSGRHTIRETFSDHFPEKKNISLLFASEILNPPFPCRSNRNSSNMVNVFVIAWWQKRVQMNSFMSTRRTSNSYQICTNVTMRVVCDIYREILKAMKGGNGDGEKAFTEIVPRYNCLMKWNCSLS